MGGKVERRTLVGWHEVEVVGGMIRDERAYERAERQYDQPFRASLREREPNHSRRESPSLETRINECMNEGHHAGSSPILGETCEFVPSPDFETRTLTDILDTHVRIGCNRHREASFLAFSAA